MHHIERASENNVSDANFEEEDQGKIIELAQVKLDLIDLQIKKKEIKM